MCPITINVFPKDYDEMYKDRTPRGEVMDNVYDDLKYAFDNIRLNDGDNVLNKYIAAGFITRIMLFEGTWQKYHKNDAERAKIPAICNRCRRFCDEQW